MKPSNCHPERPHYAKGQCLRCYHRERRKTLAQGSPKINEHIEEIMALALTFRDVERVLGVKPMSLYNMLLQAQRHDIIARLGGRGAARNASDTG